MRCSLPLIILTLLSLSLSGCLIQTPTAEEAGVSFLTIPSSRPEGSSYLNSPSEGGVAKELFNIRTGVVVVAGFGNAIPDDEWAAYEASLPWIKNSTRHLLFSQTCFFRSPEAPVDCTGEACAVLQEISDYDWMNLTIIDALDCLPTPGEGCSTSEVEPGNLSVRVLRKCHEVQFEGTIYELRAPSGDAYVMHAMADGTPNTEDVALPSGWTLEARGLEEPLVIQPWGGGDNCYHNIVRDNFEQSYHQYIFSGDQYP